MRQEPGDTESTHTFRTFLNRYAEIVDTGQEQMVDYSFFDNYPLFSNQALYIFNFKTRSFAFQKWIKQLLGYEPNEFTYELFTSYYHPDDFQEYLWKLEQINRLVHIYKPTPFSFEYSMNVRIRKKDGSYLKVLRQSTVLGQDVQGYMLACFSVLTDISTIKNSDAIDCSVSGNGRIVEELKRFFDQGPRIEPFTRRETEILEHLQYGRQSKDIARRMNISRHTVDTYRRKILAKTGCKNTMELIDFAKRNKLL